MKNNLKTFIIAVIVLFSITSTINAQTAFVQSLSHKAYTSASITKDDPKNSDVSTTINTRALKDFQKSFKGSTNPDWIKTKDNGYLARFTIDSVKTAVAYNHKGTWQYTLRYYNEKKMPRNVRDIVKSSYYDYTISQVVEVNYNSQIVYVVYLQNETNIKMVTVCDSEMEEVQSFVRG